MAKTYSDPVQAGFLAPDFTLKSVVTEEWITLSQVASKPGTVIAFVCNHCPYVKAIQKTWLSTAEEAVKTGFTVLSISSNDSLAYPEDSPAEMKAQALQQRYAFPYLFDEDQSVAKRYHAACTPEFYVFDGERRCVYHGRFDASRPGQPLPVTGADLKHVLAMLESNQPIPWQEKPAVGCSIKWKT